MPIYNQENANLLLKYGIILKKESKSNAVMQLKGYNDDSRMGHALYDKFISALNYHVPHTIKLPKITFGVEFEFVGSKNPYDISNFNAAMSKLLEEKYFYAGVYTHNDGTSWVLGKDSSIDVNDSSVEDPFGYELSSPKLELFNNSDTEVMQEIIELAKSYLHAEVNKSCGTHVHIGFKHSNIFRGSLCDLLTAYSIMEKSVFDPIVPTSRRRNRYCRTTQPWPRNKYQKLSSRFCDFTFDGECKNLHFEFRQLEGTLDFQTIIYWAELQTYVLYDLLDHIDNMSYISDLMKKNIFDILLHYNFDSSLISFFIKRVIEFKSRSIVKS